MDMKSIATLGLAAALAFAVPAQAAPETYTMEPQHTFPSFEIMHLGFSMQRGMFERTTGRLVLDMAARTGSVDVVIDASSVNTGFKIRDDNLRGDRFFKVAEFPTINFKSNALKFDGDKIVSADGDLTILGKSNPVSLKVERMHCGTDPLTKRYICGADLSTSIKKSDWGMSAFGSALGNDVRLSISVEAIRN
jgi:polyisoprenoid-binding protein YceI